MYNARFFALKAKRPQILPFFWWRASGDLVACLDGFGGVPRRRPRQGGRQVLYCYFSNHTYTQTPQDTKDHIIYAFVVALIEHYKQERQVTFYARRLCLTPRYLSSIVKEKTGRTAQQWIVGVVINSIKQSLRYTQKSIKEVASEYNFPTQSFFGKYFNLYTGLSPKQFRMNGT